MLCTFFPDAIIMMQMMEGEPECQWEQSEIEDSISKCFCCRGAGENQSLFCFEAFQAYFDDGALQATPPISVSANLEARRTMSLDANNEHWF